ncbi:MAG TPA: class I SAM-dependent methyltransferase [Terracidiphilus sp.]|jgi:SAM-dependent methyltransferase
MIPLFRRLLRSRPLLPSQSEPAHPFDRAHGVDTSGLYYADRLPTGHAHDRYSEGYYATAPSLFHGAISLWVSTLAQGTGVEDYTLIDLGCGKGRVVMMAAEYPFKTVRGIDLNPELTRIARKNLRSWTRARSRRGRAVCRDVRIECRDALELEVPDGPTVLFLFNSFDENVLRPLMERMAAAERRAPLDLIYVHPDHDRLVAATPGFELLRHAELALNDEDARADLFGVASDMCSVYRRG